MESQLRALTFMKLEEASEAERALLQRILSLDHVTAHVQLPDVEPQLPPAAKLPAPEAAVPAGRSIAGIAAGTVLPVGQEPPPPPPPVKAEPEPVEPQTQQTVVKAYDQCRLPPDGTEAAVEETPAGGPPAGHLLHQALHPQNPAMMGPMPTQQQQQMLAQMQNYYPTQQPGYQPYFMNGVPSHYFMPPGYSPDGQLPGGVEAERRRGAGRKGEKGAAGPSPAAAGYQAYMSPRAATGTPLVMGSYPTGWPGHPPAGYAQPMYPQYPYPPYAAAPGYPPYSMQAEMVPQMMLPMPPTPQMPPQVEAVTAEQVEDAAEVTEVYDRVKQEGDATPEPAQEPPVSEEEVVVKLEPVSMPAPAARLSFGFDSEVDPGQLADSSSNAAVLMAPAGPTSYVATVTCTERLSMPLPTAAEDAVPQPEVEPCRSATPPATPPSQVSEPEPAPAVTEAPPVTNGVPEATPASELPEQPEPEPEPLAREPTPVAEPEPEPAPVAPPPPPAPKSWASLFASKTQAAAPRVVSAPLPKPEPPPPAPAADTELLSLGAVLSRFEPNYKTISLQPRGLTNKSNWCYSNAVLQALASCAPFYHLMKSLPNNIGLQSTKSRTPIIDAMVEFVNEFSELRDVPRVTRRERGHLRDLALGPPFEPAYVYSTLARVSGDAFRVAGRQEDAEECLTCLLSGLQDEMTDVLKVYKNSQAEEHGPSNGATTNGTSHPPAGGGLEGGSGGEQDQDDSDDWQTIVGKNRGQVTRSAELQSTPISRVFSGQLRSSLHRQGSKATATVQSFFSLQLDIQSAQVSSVEQALEALVGRETVNGLLCPSSGREVEAWQQTALELTPPVLILHLKRFLYDSATDGVQKLLKRVSFPVDLELKRELLSGARSKQGPGEKRYRLFAVICHSGKESTKGHYITDAFHPAYQQWVRYDDSCVAAVPEGSVLRPEPPLVPYILFYRRTEPPRSGSHHGK